MKTLAFDVYGTLVDPLRISEALRHLVGESAAEIASLWRAKQLEYAFRRGLMRQYEDFGRCTADALTFALEASSVSLEDADRQWLLQCYQALEPFADVVPALQSLRQQGIRCVAFSNGPVSDLEALLGHAGVLDLLDDLVSVDEIKTFKPDPAVYNYLVARSGSRHHDCWLVSGNAWDLIGARNAGLNAVWVKRSETALYDPWGGAPDIEVPDLLALAAQLSVQGG